VQCGECATLNVEAAGTCRHRPSHNENGHTKAPPAVTQEFVDGNTTDEPEQHVFEADTEVTRYLCAAMHVDASFAQRLIDQIIRHPHRGIAVSPGLNLVAVLGHAYAARRRHALRDAALLIINIGGFIVAVWDFSFWPVPYMYLLCWATVFSSEMARNEMLTGPLRRGSFSAREAPNPHRRRLRERLAEVERHVQGNVTVYSRFNPFIGHGRVVGGWSFAIDVGKPADKDTPVKDFALRELHDHVKAQVHDLEWPGLIVKDRLFVNGRDVKDDVRFLPDQASAPNPNVDRDTMLSLLEEPTDRARPYTAIRLLGWDGELALTIFLRFVRRQMNLFVEASYSILPPLQQKFHDVDQVRRISSIPSRVRFAGLCAALTLVYIVDATRGVYRVWAERRDIIRPKKMLSRGVRLDYGAVFSAREAASDTSYHRYFQKLDGEMYTKVVEKRIFDALVEFLDERAIDTSELRKRQTTILNNGIMVTGQASVNAHSIAAGNGAQATTHHHAESQQD
jgi:hypothetical protein